ncbi:MAG TPA: metalloregulator ArsR/SmtB family transcription factor [Candidatus Dormibacteraeota bacterium]|nr:metalloregulator ArsR/SmtB family transcription factor [Candidatus Dormibacteraeota bacterium]HEV2475946.1 metalloregulator ArsR/SmtB family transcription factor [Candidatus Dormibacteraeota bacterium]
MFLQTPRNELPDHFLGFANPTRLRILQRLGEMGEVNVSELAEHLRMSQPRISWHVRMLRVGGVIRVRRDGRQVWCSLDVENIRRNRERLDEMLGLPQVSKTKVREEVGA